MTDLREKAQALLDAYDDDCTAKQLRRHIDALRTALAEDTGWQPFWFYAAWSAEQWGILATCALYTWGWWRGVRAYWVRRKD